MGSVGRFVRDWVVVATIPIWISWVIYWLLDGTSSDKLTQPIIPIAAVSAYTLALSVSFLDDPDVSHWNAKGRRWKMLAQLLSWMKWPLILLATIILAVIAYSELLSEAGATPARSEQAFTLTFALAAAALALSALVAFTRPAEEA